MERRLIVMRHAKSSWEDSSQSDHDRPLNERGRRDAPRIAAALAERQWRPDVIWASDAARTRETAELMVGDFGGGPEITLDRGLYLEGLRALRGAADAWSSEWRTVLTLGHNPGWSEVASSLSRQKISLTTANAVLLESHGPTPDWTSALAGRWRLVDVLRPKEL